MNVILETPTQTISNGTTYTMHTATVDNKTCNILIVSGLHTYINVLVNNAMQIAYRGLGKTFPTLAEAEKNYKCPKIKAMIRAVA